jgi:hypothetical protein
MASPPVHRVIRLKFYNMLIFSDHDLVEYSHQANIYNSLIYTVK